MTQGPSQDPETWDDVETESPTPVADELREFAETVANVERAVSGGVSVYFTDDKSRVTVTHDEEDDYDERPPSNNA